jgi:hypothetical protein
MLKSGTEAATTDPITPELKRAAESRAPITKYNNLHKPRINYEVKSMILILKPPTQS